MFHTHIGVHVLAKNRRTIALFKSSTNDEHGHSMLIWSLTVMHHKNCFDMFRICSLNSLFCFIWNLDRFSSSQKRQTASSLCSRSFPHFFVSFSRS
jgi:hypothetical protein